MSQAVKRACDGCHRRKVKCDGTNPCRNCQTSTLTCTYNAIPQKKGPKGSRAKVISELRESQRATSFSAKIQQKLHAGNQQPPAQNPAFNPSPGMLSAKLVRACADYFFTNMYPTMPILDQTQIEAQIAQMEQNRDIYCMLASMCAFVVIQPGMDISPHIDAEDQQLMMQTGVNIVSSTLLLDEATRVRKGLDHLSPITYNGLVTNFFLLCCSYAIEDHNKAWYYLREASTMLYMGDMTVEDHLRGHSPEDAGRRRRLFWLFYCHERAYAIQRHRPTTLAATIKAPSTNDDPNEPYYNINPIQLLSNIYRPMDDAFMTAWKKAGVHVTTPAIAQLQASLDDFMRQYCADLANMDRLKYDVQTWINSMNGSPDGSVAYQMNREQLSSLASKFPRLNNGAPAVEAGFIENLMQLTSNVIDYLDVATNLNVRYRLSPSAFLRQIICIVSVIRGGNAEYLPLLYAKINELLPRMVDPMVNHAPQPQGLSQFEMMPNIDIFDGFGNAGMAIPQMSMPVESNSYDNYDNNYDQKFSPEEYDQKFTEMNGTPESSMNSSQPSFTPNIPQGNDINNSFVGSPGMAYPGQNMNGFACSPLPDIMSPMSNPGQSDPMNQPNNHQHMTPGSLLNPGMMQQDVNSMMFNMHQGSQQNNFQMQGQQSMGNMGYQQLQRRNADPSNMAMGMDYSYQ